MVFLIYLYQRWLYPVDQSRIDVSGMIEETVEGESREETVASTKSSASKAKPVANKKKD